jgi:hypothetical protein
MIAFSCGVMCTIAVDRLWPRAHAQCVGAPSAGPAAADGPGAASAPDIEAAVEPAAPVATMAVTALPPPEPSLPALLPLPTPAEGVPVAPGRKIVPAASTVVAAARPIRSAAVARVQPAQGRAVVRKRPASTSSLPVDTMSPSGLWVDPFAQ